MRMRGAVQVVCLSQRVGHHAGPIGIGVHASNGPRQVVSCNRKKTRIRLLGFPGVDAGLGSLVGEEDSVGWIFGRTIGGGRKAHRG